MARTYYVNNSITHSGVQGQLNYDMDTTSANSTLEIFPSAGASPAEDYFYSDTTEPNLTDWTGGTHTWYVNLTTANSNVTITEVRLLRVDSTLGTTPLASKSSGTLSISCSSTGMKSGTISWNDGTQNPSGRSSSDRFILVGVFTRAAGAHGNQNVGIQIGLSTATRVDTPFTTGGLQNLTKTISEPLTISHTSTNRLRSKNKLRVDAITLTHTSTNRLRNKIRTRVDSVTLGDTVLKARNRLRAFTQSLTISESIPRIRGLNKTRSDSITLSHNTQKSLTELISKTISESLTLVHTSTDKLRNKLKRISGIIGSDNFEAGTYTFTEGGTSPNSKWTNQYLGGTGAESGVRLSSSVGNNVMYEKPQVSTTEFETHATFNLFTESSFTDFDVTVDMRTVTQQRQNFPANTWETAWIIFRYTDNWHHYYIAMKTSGIELGRKDYATQIEQQIFLVTNATPFTTVGTWDNVRIKAVGNRFTVWVNGIFAFDFLDDGTTGYDSNTGGIPAAPTAAMYGGYIGLYNEDSEVEFNNFSVAEVPMIKFSDSQTYSMDLIQTISDSITFTHTSTNRLMNKLREFGQSITLSESISKITTRLKTISDSLTLTHTSTNRLRSLLKLSSDSITLSDGFIWLSTRIRTISQSLTLEESISSIRSFNQTISESIILSETNSRLVNRVRTILSELIGFSHDHSKLTTRLKTISDVISLTSDTVRERIKNHLISDSITLTESVENLRTRIRFLLTESVTLSDSINRLVNKSRSLSDSISISESIDKLKEKVASMSDSLSFSDSISRLKFIPKTILQSIALSDSVLKLRGFAQIFSDSLGITDTNGLTRLRGLDRNMLDTMSLQHTLQSLRNRLRVFQNDIGISSVLDKLTTRLRTITQNLSFSEAIEKGGVNLVRSVVDSLDFGHTNSRLTTRLRTISDSLELSEVMSNLRTKIRSLSQSLSLEDNLTRQTTRLRGFTNNLNLSDIIETGSAKVKTIMETLDLSEIVSRSTTRLRIISDSLGLTSTVERIRSKLQILSQTISLTEGITSQTSRLRAFINNLNLSENIETSGANLIKTIMETLDLSHDNIKLTERLRTISDSIGLSDGAGRVRNKLKSISDSMTFEELTEQIKLKIALLDHVFGLSDANYRLIHRIRSFSNSLSLNSDLTRLKTKLRLISQALTLTDSFIQTSLSAVIKTIEHELSFSDGAQRLRSRLGTVLGNLGLSSDILKSRPHLIKLITQSLTITGNTSRIRLLVIRTMNHNLVLSSTVLKFTTSVVKSFMMKIKRYKLYKYR